MGQVGYTVRQGIVNSSLVLKMYTVKTRSFLSIIVVFMF